jgi:hypothetical protein
MFLKILVGSSFIALLAAAQPEAPAPQITTVVGRFDAEADRSSIQVAIDSAEPNSTIELVGRFQLDGQFLSLEKAHLTLRGRADDNDGDGAVNEDWADQVDNDGDGAVDEDDWDAELVGVTGEDGRPAPGPPLSLYDRAVVSDALPDPVEGITIRDIKFSNFHRAVDFSGDHSVPEGARCKDVITTSGSADNVAVRSNWFDNNNRAFQIFGAARGATVADNLFTSNTTGILLVSGEAYCRAADGSDSSFAIGGPEGTKILNNRVITTAFGVLATSGSTETRDNQMLPIVFPPEPKADSDIREEVEN